MGLGLERVVARFFCVDFKETFSVSDVSDPRDMKGMHEIRVVVRQFTTGASISWFDAGEVVVCPGNIAIGLANLAIEHLRRVSTVWNALRHRPKCAK